MLQRRQWRRSPRVMGRGAVLGWGCGKLAPLPLRGSSRAALLGRGTQTPACAHLNPAAPGSLTLLGGGDQRQLRCRRVSRDSLAGSLWPGCQRLWILKVGPQASLPEQRFPLPLFPRGTKRQKQEQ
ncbi:hypothetical protein NN561_017764 [Cricetulus griseus]